MGSVDKEEKGPRAATKDVPTYRGQEEESKPSKRTQRELPGAGKDT